MLDGLTADRPEYVSLSQVEYVSLSGSGDWAQQTLNENPIPAQINQEVNEAVEAATDGADGFDVSSYDPLSHHTDVLASNNQTTTADPFNTNANADGQSHFQQEEPPSTKGERKRKKKNDPRGSKHAQQSSSKKPAHQQDYSDVPNLHPFLAAESRRELNERLSRDGYLSGVGLSSHGKMETHVQHAEAYINQPRSHSSSTGGPRSSTNQGEQGAGPSTISYSGKQTSLGSDPEPSSTPSVGEQLDTQHTSALSRARKPTRASVPSLNGGGKPGLLSHHAVQGRSGPPTPAKDILAWTSQSGYHLANPGTPAQPFQQPTPQQASAQQAYSVTDTTVTCSECQRVYANRGDFNHHWRNHEKPQVCPVDGCGRRCPDTKGLNRHLLTHTDEKPVPCDVAGCPKRFKRKDGMKRHKRKQHPPERLGM